MNLVYCTRCNAVYTEAAERCVNCQSDIADVQVLKPLTKAAIVSDINDVETSVYEVLD